MTYKKIKTEFVVVPTQGRLGIVFQSFNKLNFHTPPKDLNRHFRSISGLTCNPVVVKKISEKHYELVAGFRTFQIVHSAKLDKFEAIVLSKKTIFDQKKLTLEYDILPLFMWSIDARHVKKVIGQLLADSKSDLSVVLNDLIDSPQFQSDCANKHKTRIKHYQVSKLAELINSQSDESGASNE